MKLSCLVTFLGLWSLGAVVAAPDFFKPKGAPEDIVLNFGGTQAFNIMLWYKGNLPYTKAPFPPDPATAGERSARYKLLLQVGEIPNKHSAEHPIRVGLYTVLREGTPCLWFWANPATVGDFAVLGDGRDRDWLVWVEGPGRICLAELRPDRQPTMLTSEGWELADKDPFNGRSRASADIVLRVGWMLGLESNRGQLFFEQLRWEADGTFILQGWNLWEQRLTVRFRNSDRVKDANGREMVTSELIVQPQEPPSKPWERARTLSAVAAGSEAEAGDKPTP